MPNLSYQYSNSFFAKYKLPEPLVQLYRFFFPDDNKLKIEAKTTAFENPNGKITVRREFYTFRALKSFIWWYITKNPYEKAKKYLENVQQEPAYALKLASVFSFFLLISILDISTIHNTALIGGAIAFDATSSVNATDSTNPKTFSHTTSGSDRVLTLSIGSIRDDTSASYNSVSMTRGAYNFYGSSANATIYYLGDPASGTNTVSVTMSSLNNGYATFCAISFSGANSSDPLGATNTVGHNTSLTSESLSITTTYNNSFLVDSFYIQPSYTGSTWAAYTGQTQRNWQSFINDNGQGGASTKPTTTAGSYTMRWDKTAGATPFRTVLSIIEIREKASTNYSETYNETTTISDTIKKSPSRNVSETTNLTATLIKIPNRIFSEITTITDTFLRTIGKVFTQTVTLTDTIIRNATRIFSETVNLTDTIITLKARFAEFTETFSLTDTITRIEQRILNETTTITDTLVRIATRIFSETVTLTDNFVSLVEKRLELLETITLSDVIIKLEQRILSETLTLTDTFEYLRLKIKELTETTTLTDTLPRTISRVLEEVLTITDTLIKVLARVAFTEVLTLTATSLQMGQRILTETVTITDSILRLYNKILTETVSLADQLIMRLNGIITNLWAKVSRTIDTWNKTPRN